MLSKWTKERPSLEVGAMVLIKDELTPPAKWPLGRVLKVFPDERNCVRVLEVKNVNGQYLRPIHKLVLLPV